MANQTRTYLVASDGVIGTHQVIARNEADALLVARTYLSPRWERATDWQIVGTVEPEPWTPPMYHPEIVGQRDPLEGEE
jgi:hypothetical protein